MVPLICRRLSFVAALALCASILSGLVGCRQEDDDSSPTPSPSPSESPSPGPEPTGPPTPTPAPVAEWPATPVPVPGDLEPLFSLESVPAFRLHLSEAEWNGLLHDFDQNPRNEIYRQADLTFEQEGQASRQLTAVGFRLRGNTWSRVRPESGEPGTLHDPVNMLVRAHFKIKFNERFDGDESVYGAPSQDVAEVAENRGRELFPGIRALNFKFNNDDPSYLREVLSYDLFRRAGVQAPLAAYARLYVRIGEEAERYLGVFVMLENLDEEWIERRYGDDGYLFKCLYQGQGPADLFYPDADGRSDAGRLGIERTDPADPLEGASWDPETSPYRPAYDLKTRDDEFVTAQDALNGLINLLRANPDQAGLEAAIDVEALLRAYAVNVYVGMSDDYWRLANNYYLLQRPTDSRWLFVPYDYDRTFGVETVGEDEATSSLVNWGSSRAVNTTHLMDRVLVVPALNARWRYLLRAMHSEAETLFREGPLEDRMAALQALIEPYATGYDALDEFPFSTDLSELERFVRDRLEVAESEVP